MGKSGNRSQKYKNTDFLVISQNDLKPIRIPNYCHLITVAPDVGG